MSALARTPTSKPTSSVHALRNKIVASMAFAGVFLSAAKWLAKSPVELVIHSVEELWHGRVDAGLLGVLMTLAPPVILYLGQGILSGVWDRWFQPRIDAMFQPWVPRYEGFEGNCRRNLLMIGNPGRGKSTLLNGIAGEVKFRSGIHLGSGMTTLKEDHLVHGIHLVDSPGLLDTKAGEEKAMQIRAALMSEGLFKIFFVIVLNAGRLAPEDVAMMRIILAAVPQITEDNFAVIINKAGANLRQMFADDPNQCSMDLDLFKGLPKKTKHVFLADRIARLEDAEDKIWKFPETLRDFIDGVPVTRIDSSKVQEITDQRFEKFKQQHFRLTILQFVIQFAMQRFMPPGMAPVAGIRCGG